MGIFVQDTFELDNGVEVNNYYVRVREIDIINNVNNKGVYQVVGICDCYSTKAAREAEKESLNTILVSIGTESLVDVHEQVYSNLKSKFENITDDN
tara:strand:+ start:657 stop:944 length:288 start_codon:yes stop_codon:yes gene_type:complete